MKSNEGDDAMFKHLVELNDLQFAFVLSHFFVSEPILYDDIRKLYEKDEWKYYHICQDTEINFNDLYQKYPYAKAEQMQMCFGMCYDWIQNAELHKIYPLCRKAFRFAWDYVRVNRKFHGQDFFQKWTKKYSLQQPLQELLKSYYIAATLAEIKGHSVRYDEMLAERVAEYIESVWAECVIQPLTIIADQKIEPANPSVHLVIKKIMESETLLDGFRAVFLEEQQSVEPIAHQMMGKCYCSHCVQTKEDHQIQEQMLYEKVIRQGNAQWIKTLDFLFQMIGLDAPSFTANVQINPEQLQYFLCFLEEAKESYHLPDDMDLPCLFFYLYALAFQADYQQVRAKLYAYPSRSMYLSEMEGYQKKESEILREKQAAEQAYQEVKKENARLRQWAEEIQAETRIEIQRLHQELSNREDFSQEVQALRAYVMELHQEKLMVQSVSEEEKIQALKKRRIMVIGGSHQWQKKLKQVIPEISLVYTDDYLRHQDLWKKSEYVFVNTSVLSHNAYYKLMKLIRKNQTTLFYLKDHRNVSLTISEMYHCMYP